MTTYNGWTNYETWNVTLWLQNDEGLYSLTKEWLDHQRENDDLPEYEIFRHTLTELCGDKTPDGVEWNDPRINGLEVSEMMMDL